MIRAPGLCPIAFFRFCHAAMQAYGPALWSISCWRDKHTTGLWLSLPPDSTFILTQEGEKVPLNSTGNWDYPLRAELKAGSPLSRIELLQQKPK
jgi:hypothetical protein